MSHFVPFGYIATLLVVGVLAPGCDPGATKLTVRSEPAGAKLYWNTQPIGETPCVVTLPGDKDDFPEVHVFEARKSGYEPQFYYLTARPKTSMTGQADITIHLAKLTAGMTDADVPEALPYDPSLAGRKNPFTDAVSCEVKLVRIRDGRVLCQVSGIERQKHIDLLAEQLAEQIKEYLPAGQNGSLAVATTRNRRGSDLGKKLAGRMTQSLQREMSYNSPSGLASPLDLEGLANEDMKDVPRILRDPEILAELRGAQYVILSGLAETLAP
jgi:hypothetical protein